LNVKEGPEANIDDGSKRGNVKNLGLIENIEDRN